jgi:hypothetical protein
MALNIMLDPSKMYPNSFHPIEHSLKRDYSGRARYFTRTQCPPKYYFIDFGISRRYDPKDGPPLEDPIWGGDKTVPEFHKSSDACNPFPTDVYYLGNLIRKDFLQVSELIVIIILTPLKSLLHARVGFEFMSGLVADMVQDDPEKRPTADELVVRLDKITQSLSSWKLRARVVKVDDIWSLGLYRGVGHWIRRMNYIANRTPAVSVCRST